MDSIPKKKLSRFRIELEQLKSQYADDDDEWWQRRWYAS
jgi:hypothetical protein